MSLNNEDEFAHPRDFAEFRDRIGGLVLLPAVDNASYSDMTYPDKVNHYAKQNLLTCSLHPIAYQNKPGFRKFREATAMEFVAKSAFLKGDLDDRQALYSALANLCWSPDRLNEI